MEIGSKLIRYRNLRGLSQKQSAMRAGMAPSQLSRYEHGRAQPSLRTLERLARALRVRISDLFW